MDASYYRYHHLGVPTARELPEEDYIPHLKFYASGFKKSPFGIEWMNFDEVAFIIDNGAPVELLQFDSAENEIWPDQALYR